MYCITFIASILSAPIQRVSLAGPWFHPGFGRCRGSYQGCPLPPRKFTELQTKHALPVRCSLDQHSSCLCMEDMCLGLGEEAVLQTAKTLPNRKTPWIYCGRPGSTFRNGEAQSGHSMKMQENEVFCYKFLSRVHHCDRIFPHLNRGLVTI